MLILWIFNIIIAIIMIRLFIKFNSVGINSQESLWFIFSLIITTILTGYLLGYFKIDFLSNLILK